ncbi:YdeI/OmpD-associated family protein [Cytophagaceae bacterium YF14B1]|uniref:YdeI/OmpD-associated family protein n=1 Tax=Xanthocytophaga flava TaxID=3048013 RepID=A0AAE3QV45_9BACT|nr:YdeI/OmpD-associated family protein [Xanthocytophaga flavus]MDJ1483354.1 YdeI/OmpD-associated family protein [Xanthocytophaga flavus]
MKTFYAEDRTQWRTWLETHYQLEKEIYLVFYKKGTGKPTLSYDESVEEALCFGWIDGVRKTLDEQSYTLRFTPRRLGSIWSLVNRNRCEKLIADGKMTEAGIKFIEDAKKTGQWDAAYSLKAETALPSDLQEALQASPKAWEFFQKLSNSNKFTYVRHMDLKSPELRKVRIQKIVELCEANIKPYVDGKPSVRNQ